MTTITLGINNCFACKRWPEPEEWTRIIVDDFGLNHAQFSFDLLDPRTIERTRTLQAERIKEVAGKYNLDIHSAFTGLAAYSYNLLLHPNKGMRLDALDWYENAIHLSCKLGAKGVGGHLGALSRLDFMDEGRRDWLAFELKESLHHLAQLARSYGQKFLLWEPMPVNREKPSTVTDALRLYDFINEDSPLPILFCVDVGHTCAYDNSELDLDPYYWIKSLGRLSPVIHLQQTDGKADHHWPFTQEFNKIGIIEAKKVIEAISESDADVALLVLEIIHPFEADETKVLDEIKESVEYWQKALS